MIEKHPHMQNSLRLQRVIHSWTQEQVAQHIGVSRKTICSIERGKMIPSTLIALQLAALFKTQVETLFQLEK